MRIACYIDHDHEMAFSMIKNALAEDHSCDRFVYESDLLKSMRRTSFDLILVHSAAPAATWVCSWLARRPGESVPLAIVDTSWNAEQVCAALESGVDDVIRAHPFQANEFRARVNLILRRRGKPKIRPRIELAGFSLDRSNSTAFDRGAPVELTPREFLLAWFFFAQPGAYLSRELIIAAVWGVGQKIADRSLEQHAYQVRKKLGLCTARGVRLTALYTKGYQLQVWSGSTLQDAPAPAGEMAQSAA